MIRNKFILLLLLIIYLTMEFIVIRGIVSLIANREFIPTILALFIAIFYAWGTIDSFKDLINSFKIDGELDEK